MAGRPRKKMSVGGEAYPQIPIMCLCQKEAEETKVPEMSQTL